MFKVYDSNFKEVKIPVDRLGFGSRALEINVGPVIYENVYSQSRRADTLVKRYAKDRQVSIVLMVSGMDETDFRMKRDELYSFFRNLGIFFVAEEQQPFKLIKVIVNDNYDIDRQTPEIAMPEIPLKVIDTPFKQSLHTTLDIDREGIQFNDKWAYGMGTLTDEESWRYSFSNENPVFYNAGTEAVKLIQQKESVVSLTAREDTDRIEIVDGNGTVFVLDDSVQSGMTLRMIGHQITLANSNFLHNTNANFLTVKTGWNEWEIRGVNQFDFDIDFRFLYD